MLSTSRLFLWCYCFRSFWYSVLCLDSNYQAIIPQLFWRRRVWDDASNQFILSTTQAFPSPIFWRCIRYWRLKPYPILQVVNWICIVRFACVIYDDSLNLFPQCSSTHAIYFINDADAAFFVFIRVAVMYPVASSVDMTKYLALPIHLTCLFTKSLWIKAPVILVRFIRTSMVEFSSYFQGSVRKKPLLLYNPGLIQVLCFNWICSLLLSCQCDPFDGAIGQLNSSLWCFDWLNHRQEML